MSIVNVAERIRRGEIAIAAAKARGRDVTCWEQHLETLKRQAIAKELPPRTWFAEEMRDEVDTLRAVTTILTEAEPDEAGAILAIWKRLFDLNLDRERVTRHLAQLRAWQGRRTRS